MCNFGVTHISYDSHIHVGAYKKYKDRDDITRESVHTLSQRSVHVCRYTSTCIL